MPNGKRVFGNDRMGYLGVLCAMFDLAWYDVKHGNGHAESAAAFLRSEGVLEMVEFLGGEPEYYLRVIDSGGVDVDEELRQRVLWAHEVEGLSILEIAGELFDGPRAGRKLSRVRDIVNSGR